MAAVPINLHALRYSGHRAGRHRGTRRLLPPAGDPLHQRSSLAVAEWFLVAVDGNNVDDDQIEAALRAVDLSALADMRDEGRPDA